MALTRNTLGTGQAPVYTSNGQTAITSVYLCNTSQVDTVRVTVHMVTPPASADATNIVYAEISIPPLDTYVMDSERLVLANGETIWAAADTAGVVVATFSFMVI
jgi:hypothetical protein